MESKVASKEEMKQQALEIMKILKLSKNVINEFDKKDKLNKSEGKKGILYWLDEKEQKIVKEYEEKWNVVVYHIIKTYTVDDRTIYDLLYLPNEKDSWQDIVERLEEYSIILSHTLSQFSESGDIMIQRKNGGIVRIG